MKRIGSDRCPTDRIFKSLTSSSNEFLLNTRTYESNCKKTAITQFKPTRRNLSTDSTFGRSGLMINLHHDLSMCVDSDLLSRNFHIRRFSGRNSEKEGWQFRRLGHFGDRKRKWRVEVTSLPNLFFKVFIGVYLYWKF